MSLSYIVHLMLPGGVCNDALPLFGPPASTLAMTLTVGELYQSVATHPFLIAVPLPANVVPPQQNLKSPVKELNRITIPGLLSSCSRTSKMIVVKLHKAMFPELSVALHETEVVPTGNAVPEGGVQLKDTPGQLSAAVGSG
jgi:hypothetical protein